MLYNKAPVCLHIDRDGAASRGPLWMDFNRGQVEAVQDIGQSFRREPAASEHAAGADDAVLGPLEPIDPMLALAYDQDMLEFELEREEPAASLCVCSSTPSEQSRPFIHDQRA